MRPLLFLAGLLLATTTADAASLQSAAAGTLRADDRELSLVVPLFLFGRSYAIQVAAEPAYLAEHPLWQGWAVGAAGLLLTALLTGFVEMLLNRRAALEREVRLRTEELRASEESYHRQFSENSAGMLLVDPADGGGLAAPA